MPVPQQWRCVTVNPNTGRYVALGFVSPGVPGNTAAYSDNGVTWLPATMPVSNLWVSVTCNPNTGRFVAIAANSNVSAYSDDGSIWTASLTGLPNTQAWSCVTVNVNTNLYVASGGTTVANFTGFASAAYSTNGSSWVGMIMPSTLNWGSVTVNPNKGIFVAVPLGISSVGAYSFNGINWSTSTLPRSQAWNGITVNPVTGRFVAVGQTINGAYSDTGSTWNSMSLQAAPLWRSVAVNPVTGRFVAVGGTASNVMSYSDDGINWVVSNVAVANTWNSVTGGSFNTLNRNGFMSIGIVTPVYQLDLSTDNARKLTTSTWRTGSDQRIKTDIVDANLTVCYDTVKAINLKYFKWTIPTNDQHSLGFIAQEVKEVFPNAVSESDSFGYPDFLSLNTDQILKAMYGALQKTMNDIEILKIRVDELEQRNKIIQLTYI